ncbi:MAG: lipopolysaccharide biosynthesis protein [Planctomycetota bacterium]
MKRTGRRGMVGVARFFMPGAYPADASSAQNVVNVSPVPGALSERPNGSSDPSTVKGSYRADSFALGMLVMIAVTIVGRAIGFIRGMFFCRLMDDVDVGRWAMAFGFISLITPVMLLGIPGSLPRFVEHYRRRGYLKEYLRTIAIGTSACAACFIVAMLAVPSWFAWFVFLQAEQTALIWSVASAVAGIIIYNFFSDVSAALRRVRTVSTMQFCQGVGFTLLSVLWLLSGGGLVGVVWLFTVSCLLATLPGLWSLTCNWQSAVESDDVAVEGSTPRVIDFARRLLPFSMAVWAMNLIGNAFELSDRYMILHLSPGGELAGATAVGQYFSGRLIPMVLLSLGTMLGGMLLPYLTTDHEDNNHQRVQSRLSDVVTLMSLVFTAGAVAVQWLGPFIFQTLLQGRYSAGLSIMPLAMCFCTWAAMVTVGQNFLWVIERGKEISIAMAVGLVSNLLLNWLLIPLMGLQGAVAATAMSNALVLMGVGVGMYLHGFRFDASLLVAATVPLLPVISPGLGLVGVFAVTACLLIDEERRQRVLQVAFR